MTRIKLWFWPVSKRNAASTDSSATMVCRSLNCRIAVSEAKTRFPACLRVERFPAATAFISSTKSLKLMTFGFIVASSRLPPPLEFSAWPPDRMRVVERHESLSARRMQCQRILVRVCSGPCFVALELEPGVVAALENELVSIVILEGGKTGCVLEHYLIQTRYLLSTR